MQMRLLQAIVSIVSAVQLLLLLFLLAPTCRHLQIPFRPSLRTGRIPPVRLTTQTPHASTLFFWYVIHVVSGELVSWAARPVATFRATWPWQTRTGYRRFSKRNTRNICELS